MVALLLGMIFFPFQISGTRKVNEKCIDTTGYFKYGTNEWVDGITCLEENYVETRHLPAWSGESKYKNKDFGYFVVQTGGLGLLFSGITYTIFQLGDKKKN